MMVDRSESGFSLIEFLIALAILGIAIAPMLNAMVYSWQTTINTARRSRAIMLARWKVAMIRSEMNFASVSNTDRNECVLPDAYWSNANGQFSCSLSVSSQGGSDPHFKAKEVKLRMYYNSPTGGERTIECRSLTDCDKADFTFFLSKLSANKSSS